MKFKFINENSGNPFLENGDYSKSYSQESIGMVLTELLGQLKLSPGKFLEVGAGGNPGPSQTLSHFGWEGMTLDADWTEGHTALPSLKDLREYRSNRSGIESLIPTCQGSIDRVKSYFGDLVFINDPESELFEQNYNLVLFWGSFHPAGICSSVVSRREYREVTNDHNSPNMDELLEPATSVVAEDGAILFVSALFNGHALTNPFSILRNNIYFAELALYLATQVEGIKEVGVIGKSAKFVSDNLLSLKDYSPTEDGRFFERRDRNWICGRTLDLLRNELVLTTELKRPFTLMDSSLDYPNLEHAMGQVSRYALNRINGFGSIEAVYAKR